MKSTAAEVRDAAFGGRSEVDRSRGPRGPPASTSSGSTVKEIKQATNVKANVKEIFSTTTDTTSPDWKPTASEHGRLRAHQERPIAGSRPRLDEVSSGDAAPFPKERRPGAWDRSGTGTAGAMAGKGRDRSFCSTGTTSPTVRSSRCREHCDLSGLSTNALYGFCLMLVKILTEYPPRDCDSGVGLAREDLPAPRVRGVQGPAQAHAGPSLPNNGPISQSSARPLGA